jgi:hypothetical protein
MRAVRGQHHGHVIGHVCHIANPGSSAIEPRQLCADDSRLCDTRRACRGHQLAVKGAASNLEVAADTVGVPESSSRVSSRAPSKLIAHTKGSLCAIALGCSTAASALLRVEQPQNTGSGGAPAVQRLT